MSILSTLLTEPLSAPRVRAATPVDDALLGGLAADRLGYAFAAGYRAALARLFPHVAGAAALCATEEGGAHPRAIRATLRPSGGAWVLDGAKQWATLANEAEVLLVLATLGEWGGRQQLRIAVVPADAPGVERIPMPPTQFVPEVPHLRLVFRGVEVAEVLEGDGWERYVKPFRTVEDLHVLAATVGYLLRVGRQAAWPRTTLGQLLTLAATVRELAGEDPGEPGVHIAMASLFGTLESLVAAAPWPDGEVRERWLRDAPILQVAGKARAARWEAAWARSPGSFG